MRQIILALVLPIASMLPAAATGTGSLAQGLEKFVTCGNGTLVQQAIAAVVASSRFRQDPDHKGFYIPTSHIVVFGLTLQYVGLQGTKDRRGPILVVQGSWPELFEQLNSIPHMGFVCMQESCWSKISQHQVVMGGPFSFSTNDSQARFPQGTWAVQCGYFAK